MKLERNPVLNEDLASHILKLANMFYELTPLKIEQIAYEYAIANGSRHSFNTEKKTCGKDWLSGFLARNPQIFLRRSHEFESSSGFQPK